MRLQNSCVGHGKYGRDDGTTRGSWVLMSMLALDSRAAITLPHAFERVDMKRTLSSSCKFVWSCVAPTPSVLCPNTNTQTCRCGARHGHLPEFFAFTHACCMYQNILVAIGNVPPGFNPVAAH